MKKRNDKRVKVVFACCAVGLGCLSFGLMATGAGEKAFLAISGNSGSNGDSRAITAEASEAEKEISSGQESAAQNSASSGTAEKNSSSEQKSTAQNSDSAGKAEGNSSSGTSGSDSSAGLSASSESSAKGTASSAGKQTAKKPSAPQKLKAESQYKKVKLTWKKVKNSSQYLIYRKSEGGKFKKLAVSEKNSYKDTSAKADRNYTYTVKAVAGSGKSAVTGPKAKSVKIFTRYINPKGKMIALTFDDGPGEYTKELAQYFNKHHASATLFVIGQNVTRYHDGLAYAAHHGFEIGNHTYNHIDLAKASKQTIKSQIGKTNTIVKKYTGSKPTLIRPPYGAYNQLVRQTAKKPLVLWSIDTLDWKTHSVTQTVNTTMKNVKDGDIILEHEIYGPSVKAAKILVKKLQKKGYQFVTVSELAKYKGVKLKNGIGYGSFH